VSSAAAAVLANEFGDHAHFTADSDTMLGTTRSFNSFSSALEEVQNARIFAGIHFRSATEDGQKIGQSVGEFVLDNVARRVP
jgi:hypothetical protein